jgi:methionyl-tRNA formyltransferase
MRMEEGLDTGPMALVERMPIGSDATAGDVHDQLARIGAALMARALAAAERAALVLTPQPPAGVNYAAKIVKSETRIDWSRPAVEVHNHIRGLSPFPGAWFEHAGIRVKVLRAALAGGSAAPGTVLDDHLTIACGDGAVQLLQVQRAGKQPMAADEFLRGTAIACRSRVN